MGEVNKYLLFLAELDDGNPFTPLRVAAGVERLHQGMFFQFPTHRFPQYPRAFAVDYPDLAVTGNIGIMQELADHRQGFIYRKVAQTEFVG